MCSLPNLLSQLPPETTIQDVKRAVASLPEVGPEIDLTRRIPLLEREEWIFVGGAGCGKTTLLKQLGIAHNAPFTPGLTKDRVVGVFDDNGQLDDSSLVRQITAMVKHARTQRQYQPNYKPIITVRASTWGRISCYFRHVPDERISTIAFPTDGYYEQLAIAGCDPSISAGYLGPHWVDSLKDSRGHFLPRAAWLATKALMNQSALTTAKPRALSEAGVQWLTTEPQLQPFLTHMAFVVPDDHRYRLNGAKLQITKARAEGRIRSAAQYTPLPPPYHTKASFMHAVEIAGIWKRRPQQAYIFAGIYAAGLSELKYRLTVTLSHDMLAT